MTTMKLHEITARKTPVGHHPITMAAEVVALLPLGGVEFGWRTATSWMFSGRAEDHQRSA